MMKVIFLDIDGVLNTSETFERMDKEYQETGVSKIDIDEFRIEYLKRIVEKTGAKIVLTSSLRWRFQKVGDSVIPVTDYYAPEFIHLFEKYGLSLYDVTPIIKNTDGNCVFRQEEIKEWLLQHEEVDSFVILDDETTFLMDFVETNLIKLNRLPVGVMLRDISEGIGLGVEHIEQAVSILNDKTYCKKLIKHNLEGKEKGLS